MGICLNVSVILYIILMIRKPHKDTSCSQNYRPISLASTLSKGFKHGSSTSLCTSLIEQVISRYNNRGSKVLGCFLDASKAFDMVDHGILFCKLLKRDLPSPIICFLLHWYIMQKMRVRWDHQFSESFSISNGVRQGSVLSPFLFAVYLDGLLEELSASGVGCHWRWTYAGCFCYADDIALLAPCASALRTMLSICNNYAKSHGLLFNTEKTQLICFRYSKSYTCTDRIFFNDTLLNFTNNVTHLGHLLSFNVKDDSDIIRPTKDLIRKANYVLCTFRTILPSILCFLIKTYCLYLYGCELWCLNSKSLNTLQVSINKVLRRIWRLSSRSHVPIFLSVAEIDFIQNIIHKRFNRFFFRCISSDIPIIRITSKDSSLLAYTFTDYNFL